MKIFLTGASGLVGAAFARSAARRGHTLIGVVGRYTGEIAGLACQLSLDLTAEPPLAAAITAAAPDAIVNCAAISEPAACEQDPVRSEAMNVALPAALARAALRAQARLVHVSSEQVFDGARTTPCAIGDPVAPINLYGRQKVASERVVLAAAPALAAIVRAPLLMGDSPGGKRGLHERLLHDWAAGRTARLYTDEFRQPCTAANLADVLLELAGRPEFTGVFHWAGTELVSRLVLGERVRARFQLSAADAPIAAITRADTPVIAAQRQACLALDLAPLVGKLTTAPQPLPEQLATLTVPAACAAWYRARTESR